MAPAISGTPAFSTVDFTPNEANFPAQNDAFDIPVNAWGIDATPASGSQYPHANLGSLGSQGFGIEWTGLIRPTATGTYTFTTYSDDGVRVWVNGQLLVDYWTVHSPTYSCGTGAGQATPAPVGSPTCTTIQLTANQNYSLKVDYYENDVGHAAVQLFWQTPDMSQMQFVPDSALFH